MNGNEEKNIFINKDIPNMLENMGKSAQNALIALSSCSEESKNTALQKLSETIDK